jgi:hypothetical protein
MMLATLLLSGCAVAAFGQDAAGEGAAAHSTTTLFFARTGQSLTAPYAGTLHYLEFLQIRNRWIYPDIGYIDFAHNNYREIFIGGGRTLIDNKFASWDQELMYLQATGPAAHSASYLQPWSMLRLHFAPKLSSEIVYFPYFPLNQAAGFHHVLERAKLEYSVNKRWKFGPGYAGGNVPGGSWVSRPFVTTTISTAAGAFEFWLQRIPSGAQIQVRYALVHTSR